MNLYINAVEQRTGNFSPVVSDLRRCAPASADGCPYQPHLHGFIAQISMNLAGYVTRPAVRTMETVPFSIGWRKTSKASTRNSGSSSRNSTPLCAKLNSPGIGMPCPPPGDARRARRVVRRTHRTHLRPRRTAALADNGIDAHDIHFFFRRHGRQNGSNRFAIMLLPEPGLPDMSILCPPAAAISIARLTFSCPMTSQKSSAASGVSCTRCSGT